MISNNHARITHTRTRTDASLYLVKKNLFKPVLLNSTDKKRLHIFYCILQNCGREYKQEFGLLMTETDESPRTKKQTKKTDQDKKIKMLMLILNQTYSKNDKIQ